MNLLTIISMIGVLSVGFIAGMIAELLFANEVFQKQRKKIERLELDKAYYQKALKEANRLEIVSNDGEPENYFTPF